MAPRRPDPAVRAGLLAAARDLFLTRGYAAAGLDDICKAAGVTKGALFHHFDGKQDLAAAVLAEWQRAGGQAYSAAPFLAAASAVDRALGYVDFTIELAARAPLGCLIGTMVQEVSTSHPELREQCAGAFRDWSAGLAGLFEQARREVGARFDSASLADHFVAVFEGAQILAKATRSRAVLEEHLLHFRRYLEGLLGRGRAARRAASPRTRQRRRPT